MCVRQALDHSHIKRILKFDHCCSVSRLYAYLFLGAVTNMHVRDVHTHAAG